MVAIQSEGKFPPDMLKKLRKHQTFQSFRYEITVAAIMVRAGFKIEWYEPSGKEGEKRSEFVAVHRCTGLKVTVEAKSLRRDGVLHEEGLLDPTDVKAKQIAKLLKKAEKKKETGIPHLIFIDINRPPSPSNIQTDQDYVKILINSQPRFSAVKPAKHEALFLTNFSPYYSGVGEALTKYKHFPIFPDYCADKCTATIKMNG